MERDFMGLSSKETLAVVKEEVTNDGCKDSGFAMGSGMQWPFLNKVSALPHLMSFKVTQDDKAKKIVPDPVVSSGFMPISTADAFDSSQKRSAGEIQLLPVTNQSISVPMSNPFFKNHFATAGQNLAGATMKQQLLGGIPVTVPHSILPTIGSVAGITESGVKSAGCPAQLTIFYAGTVNVYDDISPEKAQAIMFLAGNASSMVSNTSHSKAQVQAPNSKLAAGDGVPVNQPISTPPGSGLSSPLSVSSHTGAQSRSGSSSTDELMAVKTTAVVTTPVGKVDPPKLVSAMGSVAVTTLIPSAVPQARKASLARFLEKRKERAMNAAPYNFSKKSPECTNQEFNSVNFSANQGHV